MEQLTQRLETTNLADTPNGTNATESSQKQLVDERKGESLGDHATLEKWGMPLNELYRMGLSFFRDKSGKAVHFTYEDNIRLIAFTQQAAHGPLDVANVPPLGVLDMIGRDRRLAWQQLGNMSREQAQQGFLDQLDRQCPMFKPCVEAFKKDREEKKRLATEQERRAAEQLEDRRRRDEEQRLVETERNKEEQQRRQLQDALNQQTFHQFKAYAEKQYPGNPDEQAVLIRQLQTEHYHQYMQQLQAQVVSDSMESKPKDAGSHTCSDADDGEHADGVCDQCESGGDGCDDDGAGLYSVVSPATFWTRPDIVQFKLEVAQAKGDGIITVGHGHTVTVKVPTREGGSSLFWEFATDSYDLGFGVYFEWGKQLSTEVSVHVTDSDDDDDEDILVDEIVNSSTDLESGPSVDNAAAAQAIFEPPTTPMTTSIIPIYRRDSHLEVYAGSHTYPGEGVYLLKFDNSYSMWRSKTLYYRVYYTR